VLLLLVCRMWFEFGFAQFDLTAASEAVTGNARRFSLRADRHEWRFSRAGHTSQIGWERRAN
jgi:hypothetical protein